MYMGAGGQVYFGRVALYVWACILYRHVYAQGHVGCETVLK